MTESYGTHSYNTVNTGFGSDMLQKTSKALKASCTHAALWSNLEVHMQRFRNFLQNVNFEICLKQQFNSDWFFRLILEGIVLASECMNGERKRRGDRERDRDLQRPVTGSTA